MTDALGERIKGQYEDRTRYSLPRRTYTIIRMDGKAFHTLTRGFIRPFDYDLMEIMDHTAMALCSSIQGAIIGYVQSDEISILLTDFYNIQTEAWFDGNIQKMASISASIATAAFNSKFAEKAINAYMMMKFQKGKYHDKDGENKIGIFDSRVFTISDPNEVENYFIWRQADAVRNSIQAAAQSIYGQKELHGKNASQLQELLFQKGINWNDYLSGEKRGRAIIKESYVHPLPKDLPPPKPGKARLASVHRTRWVALTGTNGNETPNFTSDRTFLRGRIPLIGVINDK